MNTNQIGIIAEDVSDVNSIKILIERIINRRIGEKHYVGKGCGKIIRKCKDWSKLLYQQNCRILIVIHDSDNNLPIDIYSNVKNALEPCYFPKYHICIPIQEFEAWLLSDPIGIKLAMNIQKVPKIKGDPENINSPKEYLEKVIYAASCGSRFYINTKHNEIITEKISINKILQKCPAFKPFHKFIKDTLLSN
jgi:hypothetical protein